MVGNYFKPLRRKIGVMTLVLACVFAAGWVRSLMVGDVIRSPASWPTRRITSCGGEIYIESDSPFFLETVSPYANQWLWYTTPADPQPKPDFFLEGKEYEWLWDGGDFLFYKWKHHDLDLYFWGVAAPYWSIVIPLTMLSAWLLLTKSRTKPPVIQAGGM